MAKIWPCFDGKIVNSGDPWTEISLAECQQTLDLRPTDYRWPLSEVPHFGNPDEDMTILGYKHVEPPPNWWTPLLSSEGSGKVSNGPGTSSIYR
jgi:hypothetical protein